MRRYRKDTIIRGGKSYSSNRSAVKIRNAIDAGNLEVRVLTLGMYRRLDHLAYQYYEDPSMWWVIAAASGIGWSLQVPPGTRIVIPIRKDQLEVLL